MRNLADRIAEAHDACNAGRLSRACNLLRKLNDELAAESAAPAAAPQAPAAPVLRRLTDEQIAVLTIMLDHYSGDPRTACLRPLVYAV